MAKKKSNKANLAPPSQGIARSRSSHQSTSMDEAENGFIVNHSSEGPEGYSSKRYIAKSKPEALAIASTCMAGGHSKKGGKGKKGKNAGKKAIGKVS